MQSCWTDPQRSVEAGLGGIGGATTDSRPLLGTTGSLGDILNGGGSVIKDGGIGSKDNQNVQEGLT